MSSVGGFVFSKNTWFWNAGRKETILNRVVRLRPFLLRFGSSGPRNQNVMPLLTKSRAHHAHRRWNLSYNLRTRAPLNRRDFQRLADIRAKEAGVLAKSRNEQGAYYFAGMAIECALKACIAKKTKRHDFPPRNADKLYSHVLSFLLKESGLEAQLDADIKAKSALGINWGVAKGWDVECRYKTSGLEGKDMYNAISGPDGVLTWLKQRW